MIRGQSDMIRLFVVEDYRLARIGLVSALGLDPDISVVGDAEDAEKALIRIEQQKPDVVLMDLGLPGMDGIEATRRIKEAHPEIKIIIHTTHERDEEVLAALGAGANAYCLKEINPPRLAQVIKSVADGAAWLDPAIASVALKLFQRSNEPVSPKASPLVSASGESVQLTERELEVLRLLVEGKSNTEIAKELIISSHTAKAHVCNILQKLAVHDRVQAAVKAIRESLI